MIAALAHRGPDGEGVVVTGPIGLGHRRLAIIDLTEAASQPMLSGDGRYAIVFNGEIYNYSEIRRDLEARGSRFRTSSDTEVLLESYRIDGVACLQRLRGMFAFAIWDAADRVLFMARDRVGKKPLFYRVDSDGLAFASETGALLAEGGFDPRPQSDALALYLAYGYVPDPASAFQGIHKLPPAHYAVFKDGRLEVSRYWRLRYRPKSVLGETESVERLLELLRESVRLRMISDVPVGAFLSGGVDSSTIVALMAEVSSGPVRTFSIGFDQEEFDELRYARLLAERYGTRHEEFVVRADAASVIPKLVRHYGEPFADSSAIPMFYLAELTRQHVTVALSGDAGDENFAGYTRYLPARRSELYGRAPSRLRRVLARAGRSLPLPEQTSSLPARLQRWVEVMQGGPRERYAEGMMCLDSALRRRLCTPEFLASANDPSTHLLHTYATTDAYDFVDATMHVDVETYLPGDILVKVDIATMAHGLEARCPLLDHSLMEFAASLPPRLKLRGEEKKYLLRKAARQLVPDVLLDRPKRGFAVPLSRWFRGPLRTMIHDVLLSRRAAERGIFARDRVESLLADHCDQRYEWHVPIWTMLMLELWFRAFIDGADGHCSITEPADVGRTPRDGISALRISGSDAA